MFFRFGRYAGNKINNRSDNAENDSNNSNDTDIDNSNDNADNTDNSNNNDIKLWISTPARGVTRYMFSWPHRGGSQRREPQNNFLIIF